MTDDDEARRLHALGATAADSIAGRLDDLAAVFDGKDAVAASGALGGLIDRTEHYTRTTLAYVVAVMALRHRRALTAAAEALAARPPARRRWPSPWWTAGAASVGALVALLAERLPGLVG